VLFRSVPKEKDNFADPDDNDIDDDDDDDDDEPEPERGEFKQKINVNIESQTEEITVPEVSIYKQATIVHDFMTNWSAIYDLTMNRCYIMPLDRSKISPPENIIDMIIKTKTGYFMPDNEIIHTTMRVQQQPLENLEEYGLMIQKRCQSSISFLLMKRNLLGQNRQVKRRDAFVEKRCEFASNFVHSVGKLTLAYHLTC